MDFKQTLNLPDAAFTIPMKADLPLREPEIQAKWDSDRTYHRLLEDRKSAPSFVLHDGPPYTNSPIHLGTAFNKILKDFVLKSRLMMGFRVPYVPGYDNHGLPIELAVLKKFQDKKVVPTTVELRRACREHADEYIALQTKQFKRLGILGLWERPYRTMDYQFEAEIVRVFKRMVEGGFVYRGLRPTLWSPTAQTALADTEIVYKDVTSKSIFVRFPLARGQSGLPQALQGKENVYAAIWTTTPWTIPANLALAFHPEFDYSVVQVGDEIYLVLDTLAERLAEKCGWQTHQKVGSFKGAEIERAIFKHPVFDRESLAVLANYVTTEDGTGIVHTAPGHGRDDFYTGQKYKLPVLCPVDPKGVLTAEAGEFEGVYFKKCDTVVVDRIRELGHLLAEEDYRHSYPHAERDGNPVIFRATEQWFVSIDHNGLRDRMLEEIDQKVNWFPRSGHGRIRTMISGRPDWCVSRQRPWGVGIPVFYGKDSCVPVLDPVAIESVAKLIEREGSDAWYEVDPSGILPPGYAHPQTQEVGFRKETDVFDVWFDSGSTSFAVVDGPFEPQWKEEVPVDIYLEGSDQHRGWFNTSLILSTALRGHAPYKNVATHGFINDEQGEKMSKRLGNALDPLVVCEKFGADVLRTWASSVDYVDDAPCSEALLGVAGETYRRIRNTLRFLLGNLGDYTPCQEENLEGIHLWIVETADQLVEFCWREWEQFRFNTALAAIHNFCVHEVSSFYGDAIKDSMYCDGSDWPSRRMAQEACARVLGNLTRLIAVVLPHTAEEIYARIPGPRKTSVFLDPLVQPSQRINDVLHQKVETLLEVRALAYSEFEKWKAESDTKDPQDVAAEIWVTSEQADSLTSFGDELANLFKMASVSVHVGDSRFGFSASPWLKCSRSRLRRADVQLTDVQGEQTPLSARDRKVLGL